MWQALQHHYTLFLRLFLGLVAIVLLVYLEPREAHFKYEFEQGAPWLHEDLIAPFDFAIQKTPEQLETERDQVRAFARPVFRGDSASVKRTSSNVQDALEFTADIPDEQREVYRLLANRILRQLFTSGVIEMADVIIDKPKDEPIVLHTDYLEEEVALHEVFTFSKAADFIQWQTRQANLNDSLLLANLILENLEPNYAFDATLTEQRLANELSSITSTYGKVNKNELIVNRGQLVDEAAYRKLVSLRQAFEGSEASNQQRYWGWLGQAILAAVALSILFFYVYLFRSEIALEANKFTFILTLFTAFSALGLLPLYIDNLTLELLPFCILPILTRNFFDSRIASFAHVITILFVGFFAPNAYEFVFIQAFTGLIAVFTMTGLRRRSQFLVTSLVVFVSYAVLHAAFYFTRQGELESMDTMVFAYYAISALLTLLSYPLIFVFEKTFKLISEVTLLELSDTNSKLLRKLALEAPGTFHHSLQVANLAEEAALEIGGEALLIRTGALYHDIGKMKNPTYFIENQLSGINPHDELDPKRSARIIIDHVIDGIELARKARLPEAIIDFIRTHHGTTTVRFFLSRAQQEDPDVDPAQFRYTGPTPFSKETAILMMADSVEAAARSLKEHTHERIDNLVEGIVSHQLAEHQFDHAAITLDEIQRVKKLLQRRLKSMYHARVSYPEVKATVN